MHMRNPAMTDLFQQQECPPIFQSHGEGQQYTAQCNCQTDQFISKLYLQQNLKALNPVSKKLVLCHGLLQDQDLSLSARLSIWDISYFKLFQTGHWLPLTTQPLTEELDLWNHIKNHCNLAVRRSGHKQELRVIAYTYQSHLAYKEGGGQYSFH